MTAKLSKTYVLGTYRLEPDRQLLFAGEQQVHMPKKPFQVLLYLIEYRDRFVNTAELLEQLWPGKDVYDDTVRKTVAVLRRALNDNSDQPHFIETRWGYGYRYVGPFAEQMIQCAPQPHEPAATHEASDFSPAAELPAEAAASARAAPQSIPTPPGTRPATKLHVRMVALLAGILTLGVFAAVLLVQRGRAVPTAARKPEAPAPLSSVAVLPLKNLTNDAANNYLCDGLTENLINALSKIDGLKVIARGSAFSLKAADQDPRELGQRLGVATLLQGGVFKEGERLRVELRLMSTEDGRVLWAGAPYDRKLGDIFALQDEITRNVIGGLEYKLSADEERRLTARRTASVEAYQAYLKGRYHWYKRTKADLNQSLSYYQEALRHDPNYAQAYAGVADYYNTGVWFLSLPPQEATTNAKAAAQRAVALDDRLAEAHLALAHALRLELDWMDCTHEVERAVELNPGNAEVHHDYAYALLLTGQADRAIAEMRQAREFDPLSVVMNVDVGEVLLYARRYDEALAALRYAVELDPNRANAHWDLARALQMQGADREAFEEYVRTATLDGEQPATTDAFRAAYNGAGLRGFWQKRLELKLERAGHDYVPPYELAWSYAQLGDHDRAFAALEQAYSEHSPFMADLKLDPLLDPLRTDPRFAQLAARVGL